MTGLVITEIDRSALWLTLNRPQAMNALSPDLLRELDAALDQVEANRNIRAVVITGSGRAFCAGGDLREFQTMQSAGSGRFMENLAYAQKLLTRIENLPVPVIAAVNGIAVAGGLELILCCDIVIAAESAKIGDGHARYGVIPGGGGSVRLPRKIPANRAKYLLLTGDLLPAKVLCEWGLVNAVVKDEDLVGEVQRVAQKITGHSPLGLGWIKQLANGSMEVSIDDGLRAEMAAFERYAGSADFSEGLAAFAEKRTPDFPDR